MFSPQSGYVHGPRCTASLVRMFYAKYMYSLSDVSASKGYIEGT